MMSLSRRSAAVTGRLAAAILVSSIATISAARADISGFSPSTFTLNANAEAIAAGAPTIVGSTLNLTTAANSEATSAWFNTPQTITNFTATFTYDFLSGSGNPADGFAFVLQNTGLTALGGGGGAVGYGGIGQSAAIKFNIFNDDGYGVGGGGVVPATGASTVSLTGPNPINIRLDYDGTIVGARLTDSVTGLFETRYFTVGSLSTLVGGNTAFVGFTGGTGGENAAQAISNFNFTIGTGVVVPTGFNLRQVFLNTATNTVNLGGGTNAAQVENIDEGEALLNGTDGFVKDREGSALFSAVFNPFLLGGGDQFAVSADGFVDLNGDGFDGDTGTFTLYVDSDDGFRLRLNGAVIGEFPGATGNSNTTIPNVTLRDGDRLTLNYFELGGGEKLIFRVGSTTGANVGSAESGITVKPVIPEPGSASLIALGAVVLGLRRRRNA
jgi:hypothetical protein